MKEEEQVQIYVAGNNEALSHFYNCWKAELFLVAYHYLRSKVDAEDVVSTCFERLMNLPIIQRKEKFGNQKVPLKAYVLLMVKNKCLDEIKIKNNRRRLNDDIGNLNSGSVSNLGLQIVSLHNFKALSDTLPPKEVEILSMYIDGYTAQEIACNCQMSEKTVRNKIAITKSKIRTIWHKFMEQ